MSEAFLFSVQEAIRNAELLFSLHAQQQITARKIAISEIRAAMISPEAEIIEDYPNDPRGPSCLVYGKFANRSLHIHISYPPDILIITAYQPDPEKWKDDSKTRK